tara:strand:- start:5915 stop:6280 length:366 start_codon:yes stop_codon:yes gene_type:complete
MKELFIQMQKDSAESAKENNDLTIRSLNNQIQGAIWAIQDNLNSTTGRRLWLQWEPLKTDGFNVYVGEKTDKHHGLLPESLPTRFEFLTSLKAYNKALTDMYKLRTIDNKYWIDGGNKDVN